MTDAPPSRLHRLLAANADVLLAPARFPFLLALWLLALFLMKSLLFPGIGGDEGEQLIFAQYLDWGYVVRNPPLYTWLVIAAQKVFGVNALAVNAVKFIALGLLYGFLYRTGVLLLKERRLAVAAALSPLLIFHVAWDSLLGFSHSILVTLFYAATLYALLRLSWNDRIVHYLGFGAAAGLGILSKYAFVFFLAALVAAALFDARLRHRILNPKIVLSLATAVAIVTPHLLWLAERHGAMAAEIAPALQVDGAAAHLTAAAKGLFSGLRAMVGFLLPLLVFLALFFPAAWNPRLATADEELRRNHKFLGIFFAVLIGLILLFIVIGGVSRVRAHYMFVMTLAPLFFFLRVKMAATGKRRIEGYAGILSLAAAVVLLGLPVKFVAEPWRCGKCEHHVPYAALAAKLRDAGFRAGTVFAYWYPYPVAGNLRIAFPEARVISAKHPAAVPPRRAAAQSPGQCLLVWSGAKRGPEASNTVRLANRYLKTALAGEVPARSVRARLAWGTKKEFELGYVLITPGRGRCR